MNNGRQDPLEVIRELTDGLGADVAIEAVGVPATFELAARWYGRAVTSPTSACTASLPRCTSRSCGSEHHHHDRPGRRVLHSTLLGLVATRQIDARQFITHHFALDA